MRFNCTQPVNTPRVLSSIVLGECRPRTLLKFRAHSPPPEGPTLYTTRRRWNVSDKCAESRVEVVQTGQHLGKPRSFVWIEAPATRHDGKPTHSSTTITSQIVDCHRHYQPRHSNRCLRRRRQIRIFRNSGGAVLTMQQRLVVDSTRHLKCARTLPSKSGKCKK